LTQLVKSKRNDLVKKIVMFCEVTANITFYEYQRQFAMRIIESVLINDGEELTALFSRQSGKSEVIASLLAGLSVVLPILGREGVEECKEFKNGIMIGIFAPTYEQVGTTYNRALDDLKVKHGKEILQDPEIDDKLLSEREIRLKNGSFVKAMTGAVQSFIESKSYHLVIVEEAQDMNTKKVRKSIHPMLAAYNGTIVKVGTANDKKTDFFSAIVRNKALYSQTGIQNHFQYDYHEVIKGKKKLYKKNSNPFHLKYKKFIDAEKRRLGVNSDEFRMSYGVEFILERGMFITDSSFNELTDTSIATHREEHDKTCVMGIDVGKSSAITVATVVKVDLKNPDEYGNCKKTIIHWEEVLGSYEEQYHKLGELFLKYNLVRILIDATGVGDALCDRIQFAFGDDYYIEGFKFSTASKSNIYKYLDEEIKSGRLVVPASARTRESLKYKRFKAQMLGLEKEWRGAYLSVHKPKEKWALDDYADSLALAIWAGKDEVLAEVEHEHMSIKERKIRPTAYW